jgi:2-haloacid dehalogenase
MLHALQDNFPKHTMKYEYLLFDLDNTLLDYDLAEDAALKATFNNYTDDLDNLKSIYNEINSGYWRAFEENRIALADLKISRFHDLIQATPSLHHLNAHECSESYLDHLSEQVHQIPGAMEILELLHPRYEMCLITNGIARVQHSRISKSGFDKYFKEVIISEEIGFSKPDPAFFQYALNKIGNPNPDKVLVIGDNLHSDIFGGMNVGLAGCWYNHKKSNTTSDILPTYTISQLSELINILTL